MPGRSTRLAQRAMAACGLLVLAGVVVSFLLPSLAALSSAFGLPFGGSGTGGIPPTGTAGSAVSRALGLLRDPRGVRLVSALGFTLTEALFSSVLAVLLGVPAAFLAGRRSFPGRRFLLSLSGVPLCVPPVIVALAFVLFYGRQGYLNSFLMSLTGAKEPPVTFLYSLTGVVVAHGFYNFPVVLRTVSRVWERLPPEEEEAARLLGAGPFRVFRTVTLPHLSGAILSSGALVFLYCFFSFVIVLLFGGIGGTTLEVELYQAARSSLDFRLAGTIACLETVVALGIVALYLGFERRMSAGAAGLGPVRPRPGLRGAGETAASVAYLGFLLVFFVGPLVSVLIRSCTAAGTGPYSGTYVFSLRSWSSLFGRASFAPAVLNTVSASAAAALLATVTGLTFALASGRSGHPATRLLPLAPLAVSSVMLGFGWNMIIDRGNWAILVLAQASTAWPFAWTQIRASLDRIPPSVDEAAALLSPRALDRQFRVRLPLALRGVLSGAGLSFAICAGDATLPIVLSLGRFENLSLTLYRLVGSYRFPEACACAVVLAALSGFVFFAQDGEIGGNA